MQGQAKLFIVSRHWGIRPTERRVIHYNSAYWVQEYREDPPGGLWRTVLRLEVIPPSGLNEVRRSQPLLREIA